MVFVATFGHDNVRTWNIETYSDLRYQYPVKIASCEWTRLREHRNRKPERFSHEIWVLSSENTNSLCRLSIGGRVKKRHILIWFNGILLEH